MKKYFLIVISIVSFLLSGAAAFAEVRLASWNIQRMTAVNKDQNAIVRVMTHFDLVAIQEIMDEQAVLDIVQKLQLATGEEWGVLVSDPIGRGNYKEQYGFVWRKSRVNYVDGAVVYIDDKDIFAREPLSARFKAEIGGYTFIVANIHVLYGESKADRIPEIRALKSYWEWLSQVFPEEQIFLVGDFNMPPDEESWTEFKTLARPAITSGATTLSDTNGKYVNLYDNIWFANNLKAELSAGILKYPDVLGWTHEYAREKVSDHAPVYMVMKNLDEKSGFYSFDSMSSVTVTVPIEEDPKKKEVRANTASGVYHIYGCPNFDSMEKSENLMLFISENDAKRQGYRKAGNCPSAE